MPTDGLEFDTGEFSGESNAESVAAGTHYTPPAGAEGSSTEPDPELGEGTMANTEAPNASPVVEDQTTPNPSPQTPPAVDLLDDNPNGNEAKQTEETGNFHELD